MDSKSREALIDMMYNSITIIPSPLKKEKFTFAIFKKTHYLEIPQYYITVICLITLIRGYIFMPSVYKYIGCVNNGK